VFRPGRKTPERRTDPVIPSARASLPLTAPRGDRPKTPLIAVRPRRSGHAALVAPVRARRRATTVGRGRRAVQPDAAGRGEHRVFRTSRGRRRRGFQEGGFPKGERRPARVFGVRPSSVRLNVCTICFARV